MRRLRDPYQAWFLGVSLPLTLATAALPRLARAEPPTDPTSATEDEDDATDAPAEPNPSEPETTPASESDWIDLETVPDFSSAVETGLETAAQEDDSTLGLRSLFSPGAAPSSKRPAGRFGVRPVVGFQGVLPANGKSVFGFHAGGRVVHQWWSPTNAPIRPAGETRLQVSGIFRGVSGFDATFDSLGGSWLGPVGLFAGGLARADRRKWSPSVDLPPAIGIGPAAQVAVRLGTVMPWAGASPAWLVAGDRQGLESTPWHELTARGGILWSQPFMETRVSGSWRQVHEAVLWDVTLGFHIRLAPSKSNRRS
ncbi:MAG: hypothetical protein CL927_11870 [Deltaproteobacteria bacterium]|nr:hypothetical protein [Deltaproteobacteria bacterium]